MKKWISGLLSLLLCLSLSGCSTLFDLDTKTLMSPPKPNADQQAIHQLLQGSQADITFVYPKSGDYRSAIIMQDFTGDGQEDAIGFHALEDSGGVEVQFLIKEQGEWHTAAAFRNTALQVDRVCFCDLSGTGSTDVLIGWGSTAGTTGRTAAVHAYLYDPLGGVNEYPLGIYGEMAVTDFDGDHINEVFTVDKFLAAETEEDTPKPAVARVYGWKDHTMAELCSVDADNSVSSYSAAVFGRLNAALQGVVLDGAKADGTLTTQIFYLDGNRLVNSPSGVNTEEYFNPFARPSSASCFCRDINGDGSLEIPRALPLPCLAEDISPDSTSYLVEWYAFREGDENFLRTRTLINTTENYWFLLPFSLRDKITASNDADRRTVTYSSVIQSEETEEQLLGSPLFSIRVFTRSAWESRGETSGYEQILAQGDVVYGIQPLSRDEQTTLYIKQIKGSFRLLSE